MAAASWRGTAGCAAVPALNATRGATLATATSSPKVSLILRPLICHDLHASHEMLRLPSARACVASRTCTLHPRRATAARSFAAAALPDAHTQSIAGTVAHHRSYILLHTRVPPPAFPARVPSPLQRQLQLRAARWGGLVNFAWLPPDEAAEAAAAAAAGAVHSPEWEPNEEEEEEEEEAYRVSAYAQDRGRIDIPRVSMANVDEVAAALQRH
ncbi:uncharacterized protein PHACADRAFT_202264, partial [Phanerochaete carnosa HHB-10118-sp]